LPFENDLQSIDDRANGRTIAVVGVRRIERARTDRCDDAVVAHLFDDAKLADRRIRLAARLQGRVSAVAWIGVAERAPVAAAAIACRAFRKPRAVLRLRQRERARVLEIDSDLRRRRVPFLSVEGIARGRCGALARKPGP